MKLVFVIAVAMLLAAPASHAGRGSGGACASAVEGWQVIPDTAAVVPQFVFESRLDVDRLLVCDDGVYFYFKTREWGRYVSFCLVYPVPTQALFAKYVAIDETDVQTRTRELLSAVAQAKEAYNGFLDELRGVLGNRFAENRVVSFETARFRPEMRMKLGDPIRFHYRKRTAEFSPMMEVYFVPPREVPGLAVFVLLYAGFAYGR